MKAAVALFIAIITFAASLPCRAEESAPLIEKPKFELRLKNDMKWHLLGHTLAIPAYFLLGTTLHEGSHAFAGTVAGIEVDSFKPYPHMEGEHFVFGSTGFRGPVTKDQEIGMLAGPNIFDVALFSASDLLLTYAVSDDSALAPFLLFGGMAAPLVDFLVSVNGQSDFNDTTRLGKLVGMPKWSIMLIGDALAAVAVWRVLHHSYNIFFEHEHATLADQPAITVSPSFVPDGIGLAVTGRF